MSRNLVVVGLVLAFLGASFAHADVIAVQNANFEYPALQAANQPWDAGFALYALPTGGGWTETLDNGGDTVNPIATAGPYWGAPTFNFIQLRYGATLSQTVSTPTAIGSTYTLTVALAKDQFMGTPFTITLLAGDTVLKSLSGDTTGPAYYETTPFQDVSLTTDAITSQLAGLPLTIVLGTGTASNGSPLHADDALYANVRLTSTPEPATMALLAIGGIGALLRRRK